MRYYPAYQYQIDYSQIAGLLMECYSNIDQPEEAFKVVEQAKKWNFQRNFYFSPYAYLAWIVHRNRFYTSNKYPFLKNSIDANEALANSYLDSGLVNIRRNARLNTSIFQPGYKTIEKHTMYHYKAILFAYDLDIDSAMHYYRLMMGDQSFSYNNYANFLALTGDFKDAMYNYNLARSRDGGDKRLQEWVYFSSILNIYQNRPQKAVGEMKDMIKAVGSTPGFGWYNIALARSESYNGDLSKSEKYALTAENFKEVNIGTTLGNSQYHFAVNMVNLMNDIRRVQQVKFENENWWYNVLLWPQLSKLTAKKYMQQYLTVNQLALNPERDRVIYTLLSSENVASWDEVWFLIRDFSSGYFYKVFENEFENDKRRLVKKYFLLFMAKLQVEQGNYKEARIKLQKVLAYPDIDQQYEKLFLARTYEALSICADKLNEPEDAQKNAYYFYRQFPQIVPFSDVEMKFNLNIVGKADKDFISRIKDFRIGWVREKSEYIPEVTITFHNEGGKKSVNYSVSGFGGTPIIPKQTFFYENSKQAAVHIAYALFKVDHDENSTPSQNSSISKQNSNHL